MEMKIIDTVYIFIIEENGKEDILCYPDNNGSLIPMIVCNLQRLKQMKEIADEIVNYMKIKYIVREYKC